MKDVRYWTKEEIDYLKREWGVGFTRKTTTQMAKELKRSRGSVIGKLHRLGLLERNDQVRVTATAPKVADVLKLAPAKPAYRPQWGFKTCQWLLKTGAEREMCGAPAIPGRAWCQHHKDIVYMKPHKPEEPNG